MLQQGHRRLTTARKPLDGSCCERILRAPRYVQGAVRRSRRLPQPRAALDELDSDGGTRGNRALLPGRRRRACSHDDRAQLGKSRAGAHAAPATPSAPGRLPAGWTRIVIEKPFGRDLRQRARAQRHHRRVFDEQQVYRIDHYLAKETVQNLMVFRFANGIFEPIWNRRYVDHVQITAAETLGVEHRGALLRGGRGPARHGHAAPAAALRAGRDGAAGGLRRGRRARREGQGAARRAAHPRARTWSSTPCAASTCDGVFDGEPVPGYRRRSGSRRTRTPRPTPRSSCSSTTGAGRACPSTCAPASAWPQAGHRDRHPVQAAAVRLFRDAPASGAYSPTCSSCACSPTRASR